MTESSKDRTKRKLTKAMKDYNPTYSTSLFFNDYSERIEALSVFKEIRKPLSRKEQGTTFIFYLRTCGAITNKTRNIPDKYSYPKIRVPQIQIFTTSRIDKELVEEVIESIGYGHLEINVSQRTADMINSTWIDKVKRQEPQGLREYFNLEKPLRRFNITNKKATKIVIPEQEQYEVNF
jgi:hypothetical protein